MKKRGEKTNIIGKSWKPEGKLLACLLELTCTYRICTYVYAAVSSYSHRIREQLLTETHITYCHLLFFYSPNISRIFPTWLPHSTESAIKENPWSISCHVYWCSVYVCWVVNFFFFFFILLLVRQIKYCSWFLVRLFHSSLNKYVARVVGILAKFQTAVVQSHDNKKKIVFLFFSIFWTMLLYQLFK